MCELFFNQANDSRTCDPWAAQDFEVNITKASLLCPHCLPDCNHVTYSSTTSSVAFRWPCVHNSLTLRPRRCDSRNLNLSPLCGIDSRSTSPLKLEPTLEAAYHSSDAHQERYVQDLPSPMRKEYPLESMASHEILHDGTQVLTFKVKVQSIIFPEWSHVQRIQEGYCCAQYLLWRINCTW